MTSTELHHNLTEVTARVVDAERALTNEHDLDAALELQRTLSNLRGYEARLRSQLDKAVEGESRDREETERAALDTQLAALAAEYDDVRRGIAQALREAMPTIATTFERTQALRERLGELERQHDGVFLQRHGDYPTETTTIRQAGYAPTDDDVTYRAVAFALELLDNERTGRGFTLQDVYRSLSVVSVNFGPF